MKGAGVLSASQAVSLRMIERFGMKTLEKGRSEAEKEKEEDSHETYIT